MNRFNDFIRESAEIERLNRETHESGEFGLDEGYITPMIPKPCRDCAYVINRECIIGVCMNFEKHKGVEDDI